MLQVLQPPLWERSKQHRLALPQNANHSPCPVSLRPGVNVKAPSDPVSKKKAMSTRDWAVRRHKCSRSSRATVKVGRAGGTQRAKVLAAKPEFTP